MQDTQLPSVSPQHVTSETIEIIAIKHVSNLSTQNINSLTEDDLKKILDQSTLQAKLCDNPILVSIDELQKLVTDTEREKVNPQEPPSIIPQVTTIQPLVKEDEATLDKVDTVEKSIVETQATIEE